MQRDRVSRRGPIPDIAAQHRLAGLGIGVTNLVARGTARASELAADELRAGASRLVRRVRDWSPTVVAVLGVTAYREAFAEPGARLGLQARTAGGAAWWVSPNPSGLNAHATPADHAAWMRTVAIAAGLPIHGSPGFPRTAGGPLR